MFPHCACVDRLHISCRQKKSLFFSVGNCASCKSAIDGEASVVGSAHYHPKCFTCADCKAPLGTDKYYIIGGKNYCSKDRYVSYDGCVIFIISTFLHFCNQKQGLLSALIVSRYVLAEFICFLFQKLKWGNL